MVTINESLWLTANRCYREIVALSTDTVETDDLSNGSLIYHLDTSKYYCYDEENEVFREIGGSGT
jgi:hypothetical protein